MRQAVRLGDRLGDEVATQSGEALRQGRVRRRRALHAVFGDLHQIWQRHAGEGERRGTGYRPGDVRHAVVDDPLLDVGGIRVRGRARRLDAPALVYGHVHDYSAIAHATHHLTADQFGGLRSRNQDRPDYHVGLLDVGSYPCPVRDDQIDPAPEDIREVR